MNGYIYNLLLEVDIGMVRYHQKGGTIISKLPCIVAFVPFFVSMLVRILLGCF